MPHGRNLSASSFCTTLSIDSDTFVDFFDNDKYNTQELIKEAHTIVEKHRTRLIQSVPSNSKYHLDKLLEGMLDFAPSSLGARYVAIVLHIAAAKDDHGVSIVAAAKAWLDQFVIPMLAIAVDHRSEPSGSQTPTIDLTAQGMENADRKPQRDFRIALAQRERYYCAITGSFDRDRGELLDTLGRSNEVPQVPARKMVAAHIIPLYLNSFDETWDDNTGRTTMRDAASTWDILQSWTQLDLAGLRGDNITSPSNGIYMTSDDHDTFGAYKFYLDKATFPDDNNKYRAVCLRGRLSSGTLSSTVTFNGPEPPNSDYLNIHAAFARVFHLCGAAEYVEDSRRETERVDVLRSNDQMDFGHALASRLAGLWNRGVVSGRTQPVY
ncbi:hypothetical protein R3P38DRAFT_3131507 [Favolaschia claudopus]|uniref:HNH nuclease domain-containing protein n=1 Tax=Favolaschia claudopus TaxID=2862362 RepID=A0AAV9Z922_9AGAR